jgi:hypothetical protein
MVYNVGLTQQQTTSATALSLAASSAPPSTRVSTHPFHSILFCLILHSPKYYRFFN